MRKSKVNYRTLFVLHLFILIFCENAISQIKTTAKEYPLNDIQLQGFDQFSGLLDWTPVSNNEGIVFARDKSSNPESYSLLSFKINKRGKPGDPVTLLSRQGAIKNAGAIWLGGTDTNPSNGRQEGLIFVLYSKPPPVEMGEYLVFAVARFNSDGELIGEWSILFESGLARTSKIYSSIMHSGLGQDTVGLAVSLASWKNTASFVGVRETTAVIAETDFDGKLISELSFLPLPNNGGYQYARVGPPAWNGSRWIVPVANTIFKLVAVSPAKQGTEIDKNEVRVFTSTSASASSRKIKGRRIAGDKIKDFYSYSDTVFVPFPEAVVTSSESITSDGKNLLLFMRHFKPIKSKQPTYDLYECEHSLQPIDSRGTRAGKKTNLSIPSPESGLTYDPKKESVLNDYSLSAPLPAYGGQAASIAASTDNYLYMSEGYTVWTRKNPKKYTCSQQLNFYRIDALTGAVKLLAENYLARDRLEVDGGLIRWLKSKVIILHSFADHRTKEPVHTALFSRMKP